MKPRLSRRQAWHLVTLAIGWRPILFDRRDRLATEGLIHLGLATSDSFPAGKGKAWSFEPTPLGQAMGALLIRRTGGKLRRSGVQVLAEHRAALVERFNVEASVTNLRIEQAAYEEQGRLIELRRRAREEARRG